MCGGNKLHILLFHVVVVVLVLLFILRMMTDVVCAAGACIGRTDGTTHLRPASNNKWPHPTTDGTHTVGCCWLPAIITRERERESGE